MCIIKEAATHSLAPHSHLPHAHNRCTSSTQLFFSQVLVKYMVEKYRSSFEHITYVDTFRLLILRLLAPSHLTFFRSSHLALLVLNPQCLALVMIFLDLQGLIFILLPRPWTLAFHLACTLPSQAATSFSPFLHTPLNVLYHHPSFAHGACDCSLSSYILLAFGVACGFSLSSLSGSADCVWVICLGMVMWVTVHLVQHPGVGHLIAP